MMIMINDRWGGTPRAFATSKRFLSLVPYPAQSMQEGISTPTFLSNNKAQSHMEASSKEGANEMLRKWIF